MNSFEDPFGTTPLVKDCNCTLKEKKSHVMSIRRVEGRDLHEGDESCESHSYIITDATTFLVTSC
jgi:hypothetical protein